jgi:hypothetical protein
MVRLVQNGLSCLTCRQRRAAGRAHVLLVDGHNLHYTCAFLEYAKENNIHMLCYPAHGTHVYQGLDVVVFSILKWCWAEQCDKLFGNSREVVTKVNFPKVYGMAHVWALKPEIIKSAFRKTGVYPFN